VVLMALTWNVGAHAEEIASGQCPATETDEVAAT
jgi:hypothetical protein